MQSIHCNRSSKGSTRAGLQSRGFRSRNFNIYSVRNCSTGKVGGKGIIDSIGLGYQEVSKLILLKTTIVESSLLISEKEKVTVLLLFYINKAI